MRRYDRDMGNVELETLLGQHLAIKRWLAAHSNQRQDTITPNAIGKRA